MQDGRRRLVYKPENVVDRNTEAIFAAVIYPADQYDTTTLSGALKAPRHGSHAARMASCVQLLADKGYHSRGVQFGLGFAVRGRSTLPSYELAVACRSDDFTEHDGKVGIPGPIEGSDSAQQQTTLLPDPLEIRQELTGNIGHSAVGSSRRFALRCAAVESHDPLHSSFGHGRLPRFRGLWRNRPSASADHSCQHQTAASLNVPERLILERSPPSRTQNDSSQCHILFRRGFSQRRSRGESENCQDE